MIAYLDSSVILRRLLNQPGIHAAWGSWESAGTSALTLVEARRTLDRVRLEGRLTDREIADATLELTELLDGMQRIPISEDVLQRASEPFPTVIRALDAVHLASAILWRAEGHSNLVFLTHDRELETAAQASGFKT